MSVRQEQAQALSTAVAEEVSKVMQLAVEASQCGFVATAARLRESADYLAEASQHLAKLR